MALSIRKLSGQEVAALSAEELTELTSASGDSIRDLKKHLQQLLGIPIFRQQLTTDNGLQPLHNEDKLTSLRGRTELLLVEIPWRPVADDEELNQLRVATFEGAAPELEALLQRPLDPDLVVDRMDRPSLWVACARGHQACVRLLLDASAKVNRVDRKGMTPLWIAAYWGHSNVVQLLVEGKAEVDLADTRGGSSPLWIACRNSCEGVVQLLLKAAANLNKLNIDGQSPVWIAAATGQPGILRLLLRAGADRDTPDRSGKSSLWTAVANSHMEPQPLDVLKMEPGAADDVRARVVRILLQARASIDTGDVGQSVLSKAAELGNVQVMRLLLNFAPPNLVASEDSLSRPAWLASAQGHDDMVLELLRAGANKNWSDENGETMLLSAARKGFTRVTQVLLQAGVDKDRANAKGESPLCLAAASGYVSVVRLLLEFKADKEQSTNSGRSPLWLASANARVAAVRSLLQARAGVDEADAGGSTPLAAASARGHAQVVRLLEEAGATTLDPPPPSPKRPRIVPKEDAPVA